MATKIVLLSILFIGCANNQIQPKVPNKEMPKLIAPPPAYGNKVV
jgi:hypothetical protein